MRLAAALLLGVVAVALAFARGRPQPQPRAPVVTAAPAAPRAEPGAPAMSIGDVLALREDRQRAIAAVPELLRIVASGDLGWEGSVEPEERLRHAAFVLLQSLGPDAKAAAPELGRWLDDERLAMRAATLLRSLGKEAAPALPAILRALEQRRWTGLIGVIENLGPEASAAAPAMLAIVHDVASRPVYLSGSCSWNCDEYDAARALAAMGETGIAVLVQGLADPEDDARCICAHALGGVPAATPAVLDALSHHDAHVREAAARALGVTEVRSDAIREALVRAVSDPDPAVRREASEHLARQGNLVIPALAEALLDPDDVVRGNAARGLATFGDQARRAVPDLVRLLGDRSDCVRISAATALGSMGGAGAEVVPPLIARLIAEKDTDTREEIAVAVGRLGRAAVPSLVDALGSMDPGVRAAAARALRHGGEVDAAARVHLRDRLQDEDANVRLEAAATLAEPCALEVLAAGLAAHGSCELAAKTIASMGAQAVEALPALLEAERSLHTEQEGVRGPGRAPGDLRVDGETVAKAIVAVGVHDIARMAKALDDEDEWVRCAAQGAFLQSGEPVAAAYFVQAGPRGRLCLVEVARSRAAGNPALVERRDLPVVIGALRDPDARVRITAAATLCDREEALRVLVAALEEEEEVAHDAAFWIARIGKGAAPVEKELRRYADSPKDMVGAYVKRALAAIEDDRAAKR